MKRIQICIRNGVCACLGFWGFDAGKFYRDGVRHGDTAAIVAIDTLAASASRRLRWLAHSASLGSGSQQPAARAYWCGWQELAEREYEDFYWYFFHLNMARAFLLALIAAVFAGGDLAASGMSAWGLGIDMVVLFALLVAFTRNQP